MNRPLEDLKHEHRLIERALAVLERAAEALERGEQVSPDVLAQALAFVRGFADGCHHAKEEHGLFPLLASKNPTIQFGPVRVMLSEHEMGRAHIADLAGAVEEMRAGHAEGRQAARAAIAGYTALLRDHIAKEEDVLFQLAVGLMDEADTKELAEQFDEVERETGPGAHERFEALVEELEEALGVTAAT